MASATRTALAPRAWLDSAFGSESRRREVRAAFCFLLPNVLGFLVFTIGPLFASLGFSLLEWNLLKPPVFLGVENYVDLMRDKEFGRSLRATFYYLAGSVPLGIVVSLALAVALNQHIKGIRLFRTVYFVPVVSSMVAVALMWRWMYNPTSGVLNFMLNRTFEFLRLPITAPDWLQSPVWAMPAIIVMSVWKGMGYNMVLFLAGLQGIPRHLYEAAEIDGASRHKQFWRITLPLLTPTTFFVLIISVIGSFQVFEQAYIMTQGGPVRSTVTTVYYIYENGFQWHRMGYASAVAWALFAMILGVTLVQWRLQDRWVYYE